MDSKDDRSEVYLQENCIGCGNCVAAYPKSTLVTGSAAAIARGLIDKNFIEKGKASVFCSIMCSRLPHEALEVGTRGLAETDESNLHVA